MTGINRRTMLASAAAGATIAMLPAARESAHAAMPLQGKQKPRTPRAGIHKGWESER